MDDTALFGGLVLIYLMLCLFLNMLIALIPVSMARSRGRSQFGWFIFSIFFSSIISIIILLCLGDTDKRRMEKICEEEEIREAIRKRSNY